jgi:tetratricopeptide (TPR) repeat protein
LAFLDTADLDNGQHWPNRLKDALLSARVVVIFAEDAYFSRLHCWRELRAALAPLLAAQHLSGTPETVRREALEGLIVALPVTGSAVVNLLPPQLRHTQWPRVDDTLALEKLVRSVLATAVPTLGERLDALGASHTRASVQLLEELAIEPPSPPEPHQRRYPSQQAPSLGTTFVGRADELWRIDLALRARDPLALPRTLALHGGGGTGKTRLALEYLHRYGRHYPGGVFWIDADTSEERLEEQLHGVLLTLRPDTPGLPIFRKRQRKVSDELARALQEVPSDQPVLYIVDNLPEPEGDQLPRPLRTWCPGLGIVSLLVTSRLRPADVGARVLPIEPLASEHAVVMLTQNVTDRALCEQDWHRATHWVGHLPLALELLNSALLFGALAPEELLQKALHSRPAPELDRQMDALRAQVVPDSLRGVTEAFSLSYERLPEQARKAARLISWLAPEPIPLELLQELGPEASAPELRTALVARSFVTQLSGKDVPLFGRMHRLLADFLRSQLTDPSAELLHVSRAVHELIPPTACRDSSAWPMLQLWLPHADAVYGSLRQRSPPLNASLEANLGMLMGYYLAERGGFPQARQLGIEVLDRVQDALGSEHPDTLASVNNLALTLRELGDNQSAIGYGERLLEVCRRVLGDDHPSTLTAMGNLASALHEEGFYKKALALKKEVLECRLRIFGPAHPESLTAMNNLSLALAEGGELDEAHELQAQVVQFSCELLGPEHPDTLLAMSNLAQGQLALGQVNEAHELMEGVHARFQKSHGPQHPKTLAAHSGLAATLYHQGQYSEARRLFEEVLAIRSSTLGRDHPDTIVSIHNLAKLLEASGELQRARSLREEALERCRRTFGEGHRETLEALNKLEGTLELLGSKKEAQAVLEQLLDSCRQHLGEEHPGTLGFLSRLAEFHRGHGSLVLARELGEKALEDWSRSHGREDFKTTLAAWSLLQILQDQGDLNACQELRALHLEWLLECDPETLHPLQQAIREGLVSNDAPGVTPTSPDEQLAPLMEDIDAIISASALAAPKAGLHLLLVGDPVEKGEVREQIRSFLLGKLLSRGIRRGEAAAIIQSDHREYRVQLCLRRGDDAESLGSVSVPLKGHGPQAFATALKKAGITELEDPSILVVTRVAFDSHEDGS